jgi:hypothetical protein
MQGYPAGDTIWTGTSRYDLYSHFPELTVQRYELMFKHQTNGSALSGLICGINIFPTGDQDAAESSIFGNLKIYND